MPGTIPAAGTWQKITDTAILPLGWHKEQKKSENERKGERDQRLQGPAQGPS